MDLASQNELTLRELRDTRETVRLLASECRGLRARVVELELRVIEAEAVNQQEAA